MPFRVKPNAEGKYECYCCGATFASSVELHSHLYNVEENRLCQVNRAILRTANQRMFVKYRAPIKSKLSFYLDMITHEFWTQDSPTFSVLFYDFNKFHMNCD